MAAVDITPDQVVALYARMTENLQTVRRRLERPLTLSEKLLFGHLDDAGSQSFDVGASQLSLRPDRVAFQDVLGQTGMLQFIQTGLDKVAIPTTIHCDHLIQARVDGNSDLRDSIAENEEVYNFLRSAAAKFGAGFWAPGAGIIHQVVLENYAFPGALILGTDSHTPNAGGLGACAVGVGGADAVESIAGLPWEVLYPRRMGIYLTGELNGWTAPKDVILHVVGRLGVTGATNAIVEYIGPGASSISATGKATIANMGAELGATTSVFGFDDRMARYLRATGRAALVPLIEAHVHLLKPDAEVEDDPDNYYDLVVRLDLSTLEPHVVGPHTPDRARPISALAAEVNDADNGFVDTISSALIGSCTNSSYEDMSRAADIADQARAQGLDASASFLVTPGSAQISATIARDGQMQSFEAIDGSVLANACGPCAGQWRRVESESRNPNTILTSYNRNFTSRNDGQPTTMNFIASPEIVTAFAIAGSLSFNPLTDALVGKDGKPFKFEPPKRAQEVPTTAFDPGQSAFIAPPDNGDKIKLEVNPKSERLQLMVPWKPWDGEDFTNMRVLAKTKGKTTTDHISPAGPWLAFRGHLDNFSDNMLMGATNAFTGEAGKGGNMLNSKTAQPFSNIARDYKAAGVRWVIVGDTNYGEGSSREHAALSPRLLGGTAVIARGFARIHESNLKKQGLLALTFSDPDDYERIRADDLIDFVGLADLAPGKPIACSVTHADGTNESISLRHSYSGSQLEWFKAGSALNVLRARQS
jgi:aconitate hydratase